MMRPTLAIRAAFRTLPLALVLGVCCAAFALGHQDARTPTPSATEENAMHVQYLEIVTHKVEATCAALAQLHGVTFGEPEPGLGGARVAALESGGRIGVRAPLAEHDLPIVRPYLLVDDIAAATAAAEAAGAEFAMTATEIPGHGTFAIYFLGGIQYGLWEL